MGSALQRRKGTIRRHTGKFTGQSRRLTLNPLEKRLTMLEGKNGIIFGVANKRSIAWATAQALHEAGAHLAFAYQGERLKENVEKLTQDEMPDSPLLSCDVTKQNEVGDTFKTVGAEFGRLDFVIH